MRLLTISPESVEENLALDDSLLGEDGEWLRFWECVRPVVVLGISGREDHDVYGDACRADGIPILRRLSGGGAVVLAPGCLNYSLVLSLEARPAWRDVRRSVCEILKPMAAALGAQVSSPADLVWRRRKVSGNAQRRIAGRLLHHGTLLYQFDAALATRYLREPQRRPSYRGSRPHADFLGNLPHSAAEIKRRVAAVWACESSTN